MPLPLPLPFSPRPEQPGRAPVPLGADPVELDRAWSVAVLRRELRDPLPPSELQITRALEQMQEVDHSPVSEDRMRHLNQLALDYYQAHYPHSWSQHHLFERFGTDLTGHPHLRPGHAPDTWTGLVTHLRRHGATDQELTLTGLAAPARTGRLIDRFRDRLILPITTGDGDVIGFVARRHPDTTDTDQHGPKYLNTARTLLYRKSESLYLAGPESALTHGAIPVLVEGPLDAIAITLATHTTHIGVATLGTTLTDSHAHHLAAWPATPLIATDNDAPGQAAAARHYWTLTPYGIDPLSITLPPGHDPASTYTTHGPDHLTGLLTHPTPSPTTSSRPPQSVVSSTPPRSSPPAHRRPGPTPSTPPPPTCTPTPTTSPKPSSTPPTTGPATPAKPPHSNSPPPAPPAGPQRPEAPTPPHRHQHPTGRPSSQPQRVGRSR